jgi:hypothetical protein
MIRYGATAAGTPHGDVTKVTGTDRDAARSEQPVTHREGQQRSEVGR